jgi:hypothetical protein
LNSALAIIVTIVTSLYYPQYPPTDANLSDLEYEIDIQNLPISVSVFAAIIIREKNKKTDLFK